MRRLEREIGRALRHAAVQIAEGGAETCRIAADDLSAMLGPARFENESRCATSVPGVATGLAWTPVGGDILFIEAARAPRQGRADPHRPARRSDARERPGRLEPGQEPARSSRRRRRTIFEKSDIHIHVPAGATPKDGPSAGVAMFIALVSLLTGRTVRSDTAMTGEITLRGLVLPVGGIKEKVTAAARAGLKRVMLPARNRRDYDDIPEDARKSLEFIWLERVEEAIAAAFEAKAAPEAAHAAS